MVRNIGIPVAPPRRTCEDDKCPFHGTLAIRGKTFNGIVDSASASKMIVVSREYLRPVPKYKRYEKSRSKMHAYLPECIECSEGNEVRIAECRPLSKTISFVVVEVNERNASR